MSAIFGAISFDGNSIDNNIKAILKDAYSECIIDRMEELDDSDVYMGCGIQYFNKEAKSERLPIHSDGYFLTADVVFDNRDRLCSLFDLDKGAPDGTLLFDFLRKNNLENIDELLGVYSFAYYDRANKSLLLCDDAVGERCLYYTRYQDCILFSTLYMPLAKITGAPLNDYWMTDFLAMDHVMGYSDSTSTPFCNIFRVAPAHYLQITKANIKDVRYWNLPDHTQKLKASDKKIKETFIALMDLVVTSQMRTDGKISTQLSGGLDSTTVAYFLSKKLKETNDTLYTYTSIPIKEYISDSQGQYMDDETEAVLKTKDALGNLECRFVDNSGENPWNVHERFLKILEAPYKSVQNTMWLYECRRLAYNEGCRLMFSGSYGNTSISYGNSKQYYIHLYKTGQKFKLMRELSAFCKHTHSNKKQLYNIIKKEYENELEKSKAEIPNLNAIFVKNSYVNENFNLTCDCDTRLNKIYNRQADFETELVNYLKDEISYRQMGDASTKYSLYTGVLQRDPTKDKRILEFCISLDPSQFSKGGVDRHLICEYLKDLLPQHVLDDALNKKGRQSADMVFRIVSNFDKIKQDLTKLYQSTDCKYVDTKKALDDLNSHNDAKSFSRFGLSRHLYTAMLIDFYENQTKF